MTSMKKCYLVVSLFLCSTAIVVTGVGADELRIANLLLSPEQKPNVEVLSTVPIEGAVRVSAPEGWRISPETITATGQKRFVFTVAQGRPSDKNEYALAVTVQRLGDTTFLHRQNVRVATAPNSNLDVAGPNEQGVAAADWSYAIPNVAMVQDKQVRIHTVWNRRCFSLLVGVDDLELVPTETAVQIALGSVKSDKTFGELYQFLLFGDEAGKGHLVSLNNDKSPRTLPDTDTSKAFVWKQKNTVWFEMAIPFTAIPAIRPGEGRELTLSFLIHNAEGKTVLDWGRTCLLPNENAEKWCRWKGDSIGNTALTMPRAEWGLCSSKF